MSTFNEFCKELEGFIETSYREGITLQEAETLALRFLDAQIKVSKELKNADLDSRMRKSGLKAVKAAVYTEACTKVDKKPTESQLEHTLNMNGLVSTEQEALDTAEVSRSELERYYNIFQNAHIFFRGVAKGSFNG